MNANNGLLSILFLQEYLGDTMDLVPDHWNKTNITTEQIKLYFWLPTHIKVMFTLYCNV